MEHTTELLPTLTVKGPTHRVSSVPDIKLSRQEIAENGHRNLANLLEGETGVYSLNSGGGISKPMVHGMFGNRVQLVNNGLVQGNQQWGIDHNPEVDPFSADAITVIKGVGALEYAANVMGSVILVEPGVIDKDPHLHGSAHYVYETNGRGHNVGVRLEHYHPTLSWRITGSGKRYGDRHTPDYYLTNTGGQEANAAIQLEKSWSDRLRTELHISTFNAELGILRGSHIGNLTDLQFALSREKPFYTKTDFIYTINAPRQVVSHHLAKMVTHIHLDEIREIDVVAGFQLNDRKEYDVRRGGRSAIPALSLLKTTTQLDVRYTQNKENRVFKAGSQTLISDNTNDPITGILPLIPDYQSVKQGLYATFLNSTFRSQWSFGVRTDHEDQRVATISQTLPRRIIRYNNEFWTANAMASFGYKLPSKQSVLISTGYAMRAPAINERYSGGLHMGVSGLEYGDPDLSVEHGWKSTLEYKWVPSSHFTLEALGYHYRISDYIFLEPQNETELTIRGAFPVFNYTQTNVVISGADLSSQITLGSALNLNLSYSMLHGRDVSNGGPLINMPPNRLQAKLVYRVRKSIQLNKHVQFKQPEVSIHNRWVSEQTRYPVDQDFLPPPEGFYLLGGRLSAQLVIGQMEWRIFAEGSNLLNTVYRSYLNRLRYFADEQGRSVRFGINMTW
jgi:iron complex outermembrane receptor protein